MARLAPSRAEMMDRQFKAAYMAGLELKGLKTKNIARLIGKTEKTIAETLDFTADQVARMILR